MIGRCTAALSAVLVVAFGTGCSSAYIPRRSARLSMRMDSGSLVYERDGKKFVGGLFGGDLDEAVQGVPLAEKYAADYKTGVTGGFVLVLAGAAGVVAGTSLDASEYSQRGSSVPGWSTIGAGLVAYLAGLAWMLSSQPHLYDAVNAYNDAVDGPPERSPPVAPAP
jgi:hypothetical protein